jgi:hypothetical protein
VGASFGTSDWVWGSEQKSPKLADLIRPPESLRAKKPAGHFLKWERSGVSLGFALCVGLVARDGHARYAARQPQPL